MRILKNLFGKNDKIHVDNIADGIGRVLGFLVITNFSTSGTTGYIEWGNRFKIAWNRAVTLNYENSERLSGSWSLPLAFDSQKSIIIGTQSNEHMAQKFRGHIGASVSPGNNANVRMWSSTNQSFSSGDTYICQVLVIGFS